MLTRAAWESLRWCERIAQAMERTGGTSALLAGRGGMLKAPQQLSGLKLGHVLGSGSFGTVYSGTWCVSGLGRGVVARGRASLVVLGAAAASAPSTAAPGEWAVVVWLLASGSFGTVYSGTWCVRGHGGGAAIALVGAKHLFTGQRAAAHPARGLFSSPGLPRGVRIVRRRCTAHRCFRDWNARAAHCDRFGTRVAVKVIDVDVRQREDPISGQHMEALLGSELRHPHIVGTLAYAVNRPDDSANSIPPHLRPAAARRNASSGSDGQHHTSGSNAERQQPQASASSASPEGSSGATATASASSAAAHHVALSDSEPTVVSGAAAAAVGGEGGAKDGSWAAGADSGPPPGADVSVALFSFAACPNATAPCRCRRHGAKVGCRAVAREHTQAPSATISHPSGHAFSIMEVPAGYQFPDTTPAGTLDGFMQVRASQAQS